MYRCNSLQCYRKEKMALNADITQRMLQCIPKFDAQCKSANTSIFVQKKWWVIPSTEYKNIILFDRIEYGFITGSPSQIRMWLLFGQHEHMGEIIVCGALAKKPISIIENKLYVSAMLLLKQ